MAILAEPYGVQRLNRSVSALWAALAIFLLAACSAEEPAVPQLELKASGNLLTIKVTANEGDHCSLVYGAPWEASHAAYAPWKGVAFRVELTPPDPQAWRVLGSARFTKEETISIETDGQALPVGRGVLQAYRFKGPIDQPAEIVAQSNAWHVENLGDSWVIDDYEHHVLERSAARYFNMLMVLGSLVVLVITRIYWTRGIPRWVGIVVALGAVLALGYQRERREVTQRRSASGEVSAPILWPKHWVSDPDQLDYWMRSDTASLRTAIERLGGREPIYVKRTSGGVSKALLRSLVVQRMLPDGMLRLHREPPKGCLLLQSPHTESPAGRVVWQGLGGIISRNGE